MRSENSIEKAYDTSQPFLARIEAAVARTRHAESPYIRFEVDGSYRELGDWLKRDSADTIGTKADLHWQARTFQAAAQDAFAMNANDLYRDRAMPYKLVNTLLIEREDEAVIGEIVDALADLSIDRGVQMSAGETPILNTLRGFELDVTMTGAVLDERPNRYQAGDVLIGISSSGIHSNGLTDARRLFGDDWPSELLTPTRIYDEIPNLIRTNEVHGLTHITGGGLSKLRSEGLDMVISKTHLSESSAIFSELYERWLMELGDAATVDQQMHYKFNNGIGFVVGVPESSVDEVVRSLPDTEVVGRVQTGDGKIAVTSAYTGNTVVL